mgnify:CR=1 FL=1
MITKKPIQSRSETEAKIFVAPQWKLVWWKFRKHKVALISGVLVLLIYLVSLLADFLAPVSAVKTDSKYLYAPPQALNIDFSAGLQVYVEGYISKVDPLAMRRTFEIDPNQRIPVGVFVRGESYKLFGFIDTDVHLFGPQEPGQPMFLLGADRLGRDLFSRLILGTRTSMTIGLVGTISTIAASPALMNWGFSSFTWPVFGSSSASHTQVSFSTFQDTRHHSLPSSSFLRKARSMVMESSPLASQRNLVYSPGL